MTTEFYDLCRLKAALKELLEIAQTNTAIDWNSDFATEFAEIAKRLKKALSLLPDA